uniref:SF3 helicase domain-containing protein n=1 Tax=Red panda picorna-like virus TaxID=2864000 RepID=A0A8K1M4W8_9VIRU|nr:hypothetical protein 1 [Red panda picorna-like virus]
MISPEIQEYRQKLKMRTDLYKKGELSKARQGFEGTGIDYAVAHRGEASPKVFVGRKDKNGVYYAIHVVKTENAPTICKKENAKVIGPVPEEMLLKHYNPRKVTRPRAPPQPRARQVRGVQITAAFDAKLKSKNKQTRVKAQKTLEYLHVKNREESLRRRAEKKKVRKEKKNPVPAVQDDKPILGETPVSQGATMDIKSLEITLTACYESGSIEDEMLMQCILEAFPLQIPLLTLRKDVMEWIQIPRSQGFLDILGRMTGIKGALQSALIGAGVFLADLAEKIVMLATAILAIKHYLDGKLETSLFAMIMASSALSIASTVVRTVLPKSQGEDKKDDIPVESFTGAVWNFFKRLFTDDNSQTLKDKEVSGKIRGIGYVFDSFKTIFQNVGEFLTACLASVYEYVTGHPWISVSENVSVELAEAVHQMAVQRQDSHRVIQQAKIDYQLQMRIRSIYQQVSGFLTRCALDSKSYNPYRLQMLSHSFDAWTREVYKHTNVESMTRIPPRGVLILSKPGAGKTALKNMLLMEKYPRPGVDYFVRNMNVDHWDDYSNQHVCVTDELFPSAASTDRVKIGQDLLGMLSDEPYQLNIDVGDKGKVFYTSPLFIANSNAFQWSNTGMTDIHAVARRFTVAGMSGRAIEPVPRWEFASLSGGAYHWKTKQEDNLQKHRLDEMYEFYELGWSEKTLEWVRTGRKLSWRQFYADVHTVKSPLMPETLKRAAGMGLDEKQQREYDTWVLDLEDRLARENAAATKSKTFEGNLLRSFAVAKEKRENPKRAQAFKDFEDAQKLVQDADTTPTLFGVLEPEKVNPHFFLDSSGEEEEEEQKEIPVSQGKYILCGNAGCKVCDKISDELNLYIQFLQLWKKAGFTKARQEFPRFEYVNEVELEEHFRKVQVHCGEKPPDMAESVYLIARSNPDVFKGMPPNKVGSWFRDTFKPKVDKIQEVRDELKTLDQDSFEIPEEARTYAEAVTYAKSMHMTWTDEKELEELLVKDEQLPEDFKKKVKKFGQTMKTRALELPKEIAQKFKTLGPNIREKLDEFGRTSGLTHLTEEARLRVMQHPIQTATLAVGIAAGLTIISVGLGLFIHAKLNEKKMIRIKYKPGDKASVSAAFAKANVKLAEVAQAEGFEIAEGYSKQPVPKSLGPKQKPTTVTAEGESVLAQARQAIKSRTFRLASKVSTLQAFAVSPTCLATNRHIFDETLTDFTLMPMKGQKQVVKVAASDATMQEFEGQDFVFIHLKNGLPGVRSVKIEVDTELDLKGRTFYTQRWRDDEVEWSSFSGLLRSASPRSVVTRNELKTIANTATYTGVGSREGDCGEPIWSLSTAGLIVFHGIHAAGSTDQCFAALCPATPKSQGARASVPRIDMSPYSVFELGEVPYHLCSTVPLRSNIHRSSIAPLMDEAQMTPDRAPAHLTEFIDEADQKVSPIKNALTKFCERKEMEPVDRQAVAAYILRVTPDVDEPEPMLGTWDRVENVDSSTSPGWPFTKMGFHTKGDCYDKQTGLLKPLIRRAVMWLEEFCSRDPDEMREVIRMGKETWGISMFDGTVGWIPVFTGSPKDETRPSEKNLAGKTRLFQAGPIHLHLLQMKYGHWYKTSRKRSRLSRESTGRVGINVHGPEWGLLASLHSPFDKHAGLDVSNADLSHTSASAEIFFTCYSTLFNHAFQRESTFAERRDTLLSSLLFSNDGFFFILGNSLCYAYVGQASGCFFTTDWNTDVIGYIYDAAIVEQAGGTLSGDFTQFRALSVYGDDSILSWSDNDFDLDELVSFFVKRFGLTLTDPNKRTEIKPVAFSELEFLARRFVVHRGIWYAPLRDDVILGMMYWVKGPLVERDQRTQQNLDAVALELGHHVTGSLSHIVHAFMRKYRTKFTLYPPDVIAIMYAHRRF